LRAGGAHKEHTMAVYDNQGADTNTNRDLPDGQMYRTERDLRAGYRPGWIWIPVAVLFLLIVLVMGTGFIFGSYNDRTRGYDNGTALEQTGGEMTQPSLATPFPNAPAPEIGAQGTGEEPSSLPEAAPPLANDGQ
jgi:hypothetical protein